MKIQRIGMHSVYWIVISTLLFGLFWINGMRISVRNRLIKDEEMDQEVTLNAFRRLTDEMARDLYSVAEADTPKVYLNKISELQVATGQALMLLSENGRQTPWINFWHSIENHLRNQADNVIESGQIKEDESIWNGLARLMEWLSLNPAALLDESTKSLPEDLKLPTLQTAYAIPKEKTYQIAERVLGAKGSLHEVENCPPGIRSYACNNSRVDLLQSGELLYVSMQLKSREGDIGEQKAAEIFKAFVKSNGLGEMELIDLYREDTLIHGKLVPHVPVEQLGRIPDLDRVIEIACTSWSGKVCYFSAGNYYVSSKTSSYGHLLTESQFERIASERGARIGPSFRYKGTICRALIYQRTGHVGRSVLCIDATNGQSVDLFYLTRTSNGEKRLF